MCHRLSNETSFRPRTTVGHGRDPAGWPRPSWELQRQTCTWLDGPQQKLASMAPSVAPAFSNHSQRHRARTDVQEVLPAERAARAHRQASEASSMLPVCRAGKPGTDKAKPHSFTAHASAAWARRLTPTQNDPVISTEGEGTRPSYSLHPVTIGTDSLQGQGQPSSDWATKGQ